MFLQNTGTFQITRHCIPKDLELNIHCYENLAFSYGCYISYIKLGKLELST